MRRRKQEGPQIELPKLPVVTNPEYSKEDTRKILNEALEVLSRSIHQILVSGNPLPAYQLKSFSDLVKNLGIIVQYFPERENPAPPITFQQTLRMLKDVDSALDDS